MEDHRRRRSSKVKSEKQDKKDTETESYQFFFAKTEGDLG